MRNFTDISIILDRSGSMANIASDVIGGFNTFIKDQQAQPGEASLSLIEFNTYRNVLFTGVPLARVAPLTSATFVPSGGTALLDTLGQTITDTGNRLRALKEQNRPDKVIIVVFTDGEENSSRHFNRESVFEMINHQREQYKWEFMFLAANQDAIAVGAMYGFPANYSITFGANSVGVASSSGTLSSTMSNYREQGVLRSFTNAERKDALGGDETFTNTPDPATHFTTTTTTAPQPVTANSFNSSRKTRVA